MSIRLRLSHRLTQSLALPAANCGEARKHREAEVSTDLAAAYEHCRLVTKHYGTTYYFSTCFFPKPLRPAVHALYACVRYPDEWVDNPGTLTIAEQRERLQEWQRATQQAIESGHSEHAVLLAFADTARRYAIPISYMRDFLDAMTMDLTVSRYETYEDLQKYTWGSASVVGLMMCHIIGATEPAAIAHATSLGLAMQMTNFLRDVGEDYDQRGRIYLPLEDLRRFGVSESDIAEKRVTPGVQALVRFQAERTRESYAHADAGMHYIPRASRLPVRLARLLYARILDKIEENGGDVLTRRARVPTREKLLVLAREFFRS